MSYRSGMIVPQNISILGLQRLALRYVPRCWTFAVEHRGEIDRHFAELCRNNPALWNGRVLLLHRHHVDDGVLHGEFLEADFASFIAWRDWGFPPAEVINCFAMGALRGSDGAYLLGLMGPRTAGAGKIYFPAGTPDPDDVVGEAVDLTGSVRREIEEETGLTDADAATEEGWHCVLCGPRIALIKVLQAREPSLRLRERILLYLRSERDPELADIVVARNHVDLDVRMPPFVTAFLDHMWRSNRGTPSHAAFGPAP
jgi:8-oxo-dGTP pyrophosphatase MutT (NUDIX family)